MYDRKKGIGALFKPYRSPQEIAEDAAAKEYVMRRVGPVSEYKPLDPSIYRISATLDKLQAAGTAPVKDSRQHKIIKVVKEPTPALMEAEPKIHTPAYRKKYPERYKSGYVPWYLRNTESDDGVKKFNHHDSSTFPHAQKDKLMKAEIAGELKDNIQTGKLPTTEGVKTLQYVTDTIKKNDDIPVSHKPRWMVNYQNGELEDVNHPNWMDNQIKQGLVPGTLVKQHKKEKN